MRKRVKGTFRTTISLPLELKQSMDRYEKAHPEVNWSEIAADAFARTAGIYIMLSTEGRLQRIEDALGIKR